MRPNPGKANTASVTTTLVNRKFSWSRMAVNGVIRALRRECLVTTSGQGGHCRERVLDHAFGKREALEDRRPHIGARHDLDHGGAHHADEVAEIVCRQGRY